MGQMADKITELEDGVKNRIHAASAPEPIDGAKAGGPSTVEAKS